MRWLILAFVLSIGFVAFVVVAAVTSGPEEAHTDGFEQHRPESKDEKAAARVVMAYVNGLIRELPDQACRVVAEPMATEMRCATRPRIPRDLQMGPSSEDARPTVAHISLRGDEGHAWVAQVSPGPLEDVILRRVGTVWRVVGKSGGFGLA